MAIKGLGTTISGAGLSGVKIVDVGGLPGVSVDDIDVSTTESPNGVTEFLPGWITGGDMKLTLQLASGTYSGLMSQLALQSAASFTPGTYTIAIGGTNGASISFTGYIKDVGGKVDRKGIATVDVTLKVVNPGISSGGGGQQ